jgi:hypothetical protein
MRSIYLLLIFTLRALAQDFDISISAKEIAIDKQIMVQMKLYNKVERPNISFPNIEGFTKEDNEAITNVITNNGKKQMVHTFSQKYKPIAAGTYKLPSNTFNIDGKIYAFPQGNIVVTDPEKEKADKLKATFLNFKPKAFLEVDLNPKTYYIYESIPFSIKLYIAESQSNNILFLDNISEQINNLSQSFGNKNVILKQDVNLQITGQQTILNGEKYTAYVLMSGKIFANAEEPIKVKAFNFGLNKVTYTAEGPNGKKKTEPLNLTTQPFTIKIRKLPPYPSDQQVYVGYLNQKHAIKQGTYSTGKAMNWQVTYTGNGLLDLLSPPTPKNDETFDFFNLKTETSLKNNEKKLSVQALPKKQGPVALKNYLYLYFFNTEINNYDTLAVDINLNIAGESLNINTVDPEKASESIFDGLKDMKSTLEFTDYSKIVKRAANLFYPFIIISFIIIVLWKRN